MVWMEIGHYRPGHKHSEWGCWRSGPFFHVFLHTSDESYTLLPTVLQTMPQRSRSCVQARSTRIKCWSCTHLQTKNILNLYIIYVSNNFCNTNRCHGHDVTAGQDQYSRPCFYRPIWVFLARVGTSFPDPNQEFFVPTPNQSVSTPILSI